MTMNATRLGNDIVAKMITAGSTFSTAQETATKVNMVALAQAVIDEIEDFYSGGGGGTPSDDDPQPLGTADPGVSALYSRGDHVHEMPDAADVGADPAGTASTAITTHLSAAPHVALSSSTPAALGVAAVGVGTTSARADHVHAMPSAANVGALALDGSNSPTANINLGGYRLTNAGAATSGSGLTTLDQVNAIVEGRAFQDPVISATTGTPPASPTTGDRYVVPVGAGGAWLTLDDLIVEWDGSTWDQTTPVEGTTVAVQDSGTFLRYNDAYPAGSWTNLGSAVDHAALINRAWAASGHTGTASRLAGFDGSGVAAYYQIGADVQAYNATLAAVAAGTYTGGTSITTLGDVTTCDKLAAGSSAAISVAGTPVSWRVRASGTGGSALAAEWIGSRINSTHPGVSMVTAAARASGASPAALSSGDPLWEHYAAGYDGSGYYAGARARVVAAAAPSTGVIPTKWEWYTTSIAGSTLVQATLDSANGWTLTVPLAIGSGGHGQTTASAGFDALKQTATTSSSGVVELATDGEEATAKVLDTDHWRARYSYPVLTGGWVAPLNGTPVGTGLMGSLSFTGTHASTFLAGYGPTRSVVSGATERGWFIANTSSIMTFDNSVGTWLVGGVALSTLSNFRYYVGISASGANANTYTSTTRRIALGIEGSAFRWVLADGTNYNSNVFTASPSANTVYLFEIRFTSASSVTFIVRDALGVEIERTTQTANVPTGSSNPVMAGSGYATSGTPTAYQTCGLVRFDQ